jgi:hypothetical protein
MLAQNSDVSPAMQRKETITLTPEYVFILDTAYFSRLHSWSKLSNFIALDLKKEQVIIHNYYQYYIGRGTEYHS